MENLNYKKEDIEKKYLNNMQENYFLKVKDSLLELEKDVIELKDRELKDRKVKIEREIEEIFLKTRPVKNTWHDWLFNYIPDPIRKGASGFKDKILSLFNANTLKQTVHERENN